MNTRLTAPQTATEDPQSVSSREAIDEPALLQRSVQGKAADSGISDSSTLPQSRPVGHMQTTVNATSRRGTTGESGNEETIILLPTISADNSARDASAARNSRKETKETPKPGYSAPSDPFPGGDPGSGDTGGANSVTTHGKDPGSGDPGDSSDGASDHDSHH
jgi:hypothetical protein